MRGSIRGAVIRVKGNLTVSEGINTGEAGSILVEGGLQAAFVESSRIYCQGEIVVEKAIINSDIISGKFIEVRNNLTGVVAGGEVSCREYLKAANCGFQNGAFTRLNVGVDWRLERTVRLRKSRLERILELQASDRQALREILAWVKKGLTKKQQEQRNAIQARLVKSRRLLESMQKHLEAAQAQLNYNPNSKVFISHTIYGNVDIYIGGRVIPMKKDVAGVAVLAKKKHGASIVTIDIGLRLEAEEPSTLL